MGWTWVWRCGGGGGQRKRDRTAFQEKGQGRGGSGVKVQKSRVGGTLSVRGEAEGSRLVAGHVQKAELRSEVAGGLESYTQRLTWSDLPFKGPLLSFLPSQTQHS